MFGNPFLLWGMGLVGVPVLIHLLNRRQFKIVRWAAMEYLLAANKRNRRRVRLEHFLVLLLRCLAVALIVLAVTRPVTTSGAFAFLPGARDVIDRVVILDDSASMDYRSGQTTSWDKARRLLDKLIEELRDSRPGDRLTVIRCSQLEPETYRTTMRSQEIDERLDRLSETPPVDKTFDVAGTLERLINRLAEEDQGTAAPRRVYYVLSDLRARDWVGEQGQLPQKIGDAARLAGEEARFLFADVGVDETRNLTVSGFRPVEKLAMAGVPLELEIKVKNHGPEAVRDVPLTLETAEARVPIPPLPLVEPNGGEASIRFRYTFAEPGVASVSVRLPDDALVRDDARHLALDVSEALKVLLVDGEPGARELDSETAFLDFALAPPDDSGLTNTGVLPAPVLQDELREVRLEDYDSVIACNVDRWPPDRVEDLVRYVERGGGLAVFLGDRVDTEGWNEDFWGGERGLLPAKLGPRFPEPEPEERPSLLAPEGTEHPMASVFVGEDGQPYGFIRSIRARIRLRLETKASDEEERGAPSTVVLTYDDGARTPFLVEKTLGKGRTLLFNTTADRGWSSFPANPSFPIAAQQLVRLLAPAATEGKLWASGEPLERAINPALYNPATKLILPTPASAQADAEDPEPRDLFAEPREGSDSLWVRFEDTLISGVYRLQLDPRQSGPPTADAFAVNLDPGEGETAKADPARIQPALDDVKAQFVRPSTQEGLLTFSDGTRTELWRSCLLILLAVLALEQLVAWYAAHHAKPEDLAQFEVPPTPSRLGASA